MSFEISSSAPLPTRKERELKNPRKVRKCPPNIRSAYDTYARAYKAVYGILPTGFIYDKTTHLIAIGNSAGVSLMRLKELTRMLKARV